MAASPILYVYYPPENDDSYPGVPNRNITEADWSTFTFSQRRTIEDAFTGYSRRKVWLHRDQVTETEAERAAREEAERLARLEYNRQNSLVRYGQVETIIDQMAVMPSAAEITTLQADVAAVAEVPAQVDTLASQVADKANTATVTPLVTAQRGTYHIDNYPSVQAALTAAGNAGGGTVTGTPGTTYAQTTTLTVPANVKLSGVTLTFAGNSTFDRAAIAMTGAGASVERCTITLTAGDYTRVIAHKASGTASRNNTIRASGLTHATPTPGVYTDAFYAIWSSSTGAALTNIVIEGNDISFTGVNFGDGVQASNCPGIVVRSNRVHDCIFTWTSGTDNYHFWGVYVSQGSPGAVIEGNRIERHPGSGIHSNVGDTTKRAQDYGRKIVNNTVVDCAYIGIGVDFSQGAVVTGNAVSGCERNMVVLGSHGTSVSGNAIGDAALWPGITRLGAEVNALVVSDSTGTIIAANTFLASTLVDLIVSVTNAPRTTVDVNIFGPTTGAEYGVRMIGASTSCIVRGNLFSEGARPAMALSATNTSTGCVFEGNIVPLPGSVTAQPSIFLIGDCVARGNVVTMPAAASWIGVRVGGDGCQVAGNRIRGGATGLWVASGAGSHVLDNMISGFLTADIADSGTATVIRRPGAA